MGCRESADRGYGVLTVHFIHSRQGYDAPALTDKAAAKENYAHCD